ncbi:ORF084 [Staphylococcus phage 85]|uniref:ORF087 n=2 Tax=Azeredovirinae TaxID=2842522 RepID=Q4ZAM6_9CAUD|nr:ORF084 [Staphylococcus phage 85]AAX91921.1 ORF087 [Staphylococcus phage 88]
MTESNNPAGVGKKLQDDNMLTISLCGLSVLTSKAKQLHDQYNLLRKHLKRKQLSHNLKR